MRRGWAILLILVVSARAGDDVATPNRWGDVRGTPSGSYASRAAPVVRDPVEAFRIALPGDALHTPLIWQGLAYIVCADGEERTLVAVDVHLGAIVAKKSLAKDVTGPPAVWNGIVVYSNGGRELVALRRHKRSFKRLWKSRGGTFGDPVFWKSDIFVINAGQLQCYRVGRSEPSWSQGRSLRGKPAVFGPAVYAVGHREQSGYAPELMLYAHDRKTGARTSQVACGHYAKDSEVTPGRGDAFSVTVGRRYAFVHPPRGLAGRNGTYALARADHEVRNGRAILRDAGLVDYETTPSLHGGGYVAAYTNKGAVVWGYFSKDRIHPFASTRTHPRLLARRVPPVLVGDVVYFGHWAADVRSFEILWKLRGTRVTLPVAPADGLVLLVTGKPPRTLLALREKGAE